MPWINLRPPKLTFVEASIGKVMACSPASLQKVLAGASFVPLFPTLVISKAPSGELSAPRRTLKLMGVGANSFL